MNDWLMKVYTNLEPARDILWITHRAITNPLNLENLQNNSRIYTFYTY